MLTNFDFSTQYYPRTKNRKDPFIGESDFFTLKTDKKIIL